MRSEAAMDKALDVPEIRTGRLTLRGHRLGDLDACAAMWANPEVTRYIGGNPFVLEDVWTKLLRYVGHWTIMGFGYWVVVESASGRFLGEVGFADFKRNIDPPLAAPEIGWAFDPSAHGHGYATEAVRAAVAWADANLPAGRTVCLISPDNLPSLRVADKCGYREFARTIYKGEPTVLFERPTP
jgi:RimJ/RimL family protein N-acetyltransferase